MDLNIITATLNLEEKVEGTLEAIGTEDHFLNITPVAQTLWYIPPTQTSCSPISSSPLLLLLSIFQLPLPSPHAPNLLRRFCLLPFIWVHICLSHGTHCFPASLAVWTVGWQSPDPCQYLSLMYEWTLGVRSMWRDEFSAWTHAGGSRHCPG